MHTDLCLAVDVGTSSVKAGIIQADGQLICSGKGAIRYPGNHFDQLHPDELIRAFQTAIQQLDPLSGISSIAISGNGPTLVPVDSTGRHLDTVLMWLDKRDIPDSRGQSFFLPKVSWFREHCMKKYEQTRYFLSCAEYIVAYISGEYHTASPSTDFDQLFWGADDFGYYEMDPELFPPFLRPGEIAGKVNAAASEMLGIPAGIPCVASGSDFLMSLLGTATVRTGMICDRAGSSEGINYCTDRHIQEPRLRTLPHVIPGLFNTAGILSSTGLLFEWYRRFTGMQSLSYADMLAIISGTDQPSPWFFPTLHSGASWEFHHGMFYGLGAGHGAAEMGKAVVQSIAYAVRETIEILRESVGPVTSMRACGGQARNRIWNQMKADIAGVAIEVPEVPEAELTGNAACCFTAMGYYRNVCDAAESMVRIEHEYLPDMERFHASDEDYRSYRSVYDSFRKAEKTRTV
ncbi:xylulokinase [Spirochaeta dissipatitropha]